MFQFKTFASLVLIAVSAIGYMAAPTEAKKETQERKNPKFTENQQVIGTFKSGKYYRNVVNIPEWQHAIMSKHGIPMETQMLLRTINTMECGDENGFCENRFDC